MVKKVNRQDGFALLEVLLAWFILSASLLVLIAWQIGSLQLVQRSYWRALAYNRLVSIAEVFYAISNRALRQQLFADWQQTNRVLLPPHSSSHYQCRTHQCDVWLTLPWKKPIAVHVTLPFTD